MGREVAFDYSKAAPFVRAEELEKHEKRSYVR